MRFQYTASLAAGASTANILNGSLVELVNKPSLVKIGLVGSAAGLLATVNSGADTLMEESPVSPANRFPVDPDDFFKDVAEPGDRLRIAIRNPTAGALTINAVVEVVPIAGR